MLFGEFGALTMTFTYLLFLLLPLVIGFYLSLAILEQRLQSRGKDTRAAIERRLAAARNELEHAGEMQYIIINQEFTVACQQLIGIADSARCRFRQQLALNPELFAALGIPTD